MREEAELRALVSETVHRDMKNRRMTALYLASTRCKPDEAERLTRQYGRPPFFPPVPDALVLYLSQRELDALNSPHVPLRMPED